MVDVDQTNSIHASFVLRLNATRCHHGGLINKSIVGYSVETYCTFQEQPLGIVACRVLNGCVCRDRTRPR